MGRETTHRQSWKNVPSYLIYFVVQWSDDPTALIGQSRLIEMRCLDASGHYKVGRPELSDHREIERSEPSDHLGFFFLANYGPSTDHVPQAIARIGRGCKNYFQKMFPK